MARGWLGMGPAKGFYTASRQTDAVNGHLNPMFEMAGKPRRLIEVQERA